MPLRTTLLREIHRRFVWQALVLYLVGASAVFLGLRAVAHALGLPGWALAYAASLLFLGAPFVLATTFVQGGVPFLKRRPYRDEVDPNELEGLTPEQVHVLPVAWAFTWRNTVLGGVCAAVLLVSSVVAYFGTWAAGVGPFASLVAQRLVVRGDVLVVTALEDGGTGVGARIGQAVVEALGEGQVLRVVDATELAPAMARQEAEWRGHRTVLMGEVSERRGELVVRVVLSAVASGRELAAFRVEADGAEEIPDAAARLARLIRHRSGEPIAWPGVRAEPY